MDWRYQYFVYLSEWATQLTNRTNFLIIFGKLDIDPWKFKGFFFALFLHEQWKSNWGSLCLWVCAVLVVSKIERQSFIKRPKVNQSPLEQ
jgi:hypothetical protein